MELPKALKSADVARLFPVVSETGKEQRATSILLSVLSAVPPFAHAILSHVGQGVGSRTSVNTFTEVVFQSGNRQSKAYRPDGLIEVSTGRRKWSALIESKIGNSLLEREQVEHYLTLARENSVDALITISNQFAVLPTHHPIEIQRTLTRRTALYHLSWTFILTEAVLMHEQSALDDHEQAFLLREFVRFFSHPSAGVSGFVQSPKEWGEAIDQIRAGATIQKGAISERIVSAWYQELRDLSLRMSRIIGCNVTVWLSRAHTRDSEVRLRDDVNKLCSKGILEGYLCVPNAANGISVIADPNNRSLRASMQLDAPRDRKSNKARLNWLLRQLGDIDHEDIYVCIRWYYRAELSIHRLREIRENPDLISCPSGNPELIQFEVTLTSSNVRRFMGRRTFIEEMEKLVPTFYELVGQNLQAWKPMPPKPRHSIVDDTQAESVPENKESEVAPTASPGNAHTELIEVPAFLRRFVD